MTTIRLADHDWLSAPADAPANTRWEGLIDPAGITTVAQLGFWAWDSSAMQAGTAQVRLLDADGLLDTAALDGLAGETVALQLADLDGSLAAATPLARYIVERLTADSDGRKTLTLRDAHDALDKQVLNPGTFAADVAGLAGQPQPMSIGAVFNAPVLLTGSDRSVGWLADAPQAVAVLRDRGDPMEWGTFELDTYQQQVLLASPALGPMTANLTSIGVVAGEPTPATMQQALREIMRRAGITAWSSADAAAIDTATGYAGIGYYAAQPVIARAVLATLCATYGAWYWQDGDGVLRFTRIVDPEGLAPVMEIDASDLLGDLVHTADAAPGLTTRMAFRLNYRPMRDNEFVSDLADVPHELRAQLAAPQGGIVTAAGADTLPEQYRAAKQADPFPSLFWDPADAQAEIDRVVALYQTVRRNWVATIRSATAPLPGQCCLLTYPRHGLASGRKLLVRRVERNPATGDLKLTLWG
ncbi:MAG TPA: hypothetical protein VGE22_02690 [Solimonas sp.]